MLEEDLWDISEEMEAANADLADMGEETEASYADVLLSEPDEECRSRAPGREYVLPEFYLSHQEKKSMEQETFADEKEKLKEKSWDKQAPETLEEIRRHIDEDLLAEKEKEEPEEEVFETTPARGEEDLEWLPTQRVSGTIINREVVYDTEGGFVVKVVYKQNDEVKTAYYTVSKVEGIEQALDDLSSYQPVIEERPSQRAYEPEARPPAPRLTPASDESQQKRSLLDGFFRKKQG
ncbi:MAG: hypothetical protein PHZ19_00005 [Candidatus Thermoplasmatota archaeon]|nr:hypothetical protein [Candidatus Thermoplasmatota archaeon]